MKHGRFFLIPEGPKDCEWLRSRATPLNDHNCPRWLSPADRDFYRYVGSNSSAELNAADSEAFELEVAQLHISGLLTDTDVADSHRWNVYIRSTEDYSLWSIGIYAGSSPLLLHPANGAPNPVLSRDDVTDATAAFVADPFMVLQDANWYMFFELFNWHSNKGEIGLATSRDGLNWSYNQRVLIEPFHLSYPYVFEHLGEYFMVPETRQAGAVRLYHATQFPTQWEFHKTLLSRESLVDASVFYKDQKWWLLACDCLPGPAYDLRLYYADSLLDAWQEHPRSPIVRQNHRIARPAGRILDYHDTLIRFAQNCEGAYGREVTAFEIKQLSSTQYSEIAVPAPILKASGTGWNASGMHHLDAHEIRSGDWLACVDGWV